MKEFLQEGRKNLKKVPKEEIHIVESFSEIDDQPDEVYPNLFIGSIHCANNHEILKKNNIKHVITMCFEELPKKYDGITYHEELVKDAHTFDISIVFPRVFEIIDSCIKDKNEKVLVHCMLGISRSGSICIGYVMKEEKLKFLETWRKLKKIRSIIHPNETFKKSLITFEKKI